MNSLPPTPNPRGTHTLTKPLARHMKRAVKRVERSLVRPADQRAPRVPALPWLTMQPAVMLTTLGPGSLTSPAATGTCQIYRDVDTGFGLWAAETGAVSSTIAQTFPHGSQVSVFWRNGIWWIALTGGPVNNPVYWARSPSGGISAAGGSWTGGLSASTWVSQIMVDTGGSPAGLGVVTTGAVVKWFYKDSAPAYTLIPCIANGDGTYDALGNSCTAV